MNAQDRVIEILTAERDALRAQCGALDLDLTTILDDLHVHQLGFTRLNAQNKALVAALREAIMWADTRMIPREYLYWREGAIAALSGQTSPVVNVGDRSMGSSKWNGLCVNGLHGLDYYFQPCDLCAKSALSEEKP